MATEQVANFSRFFSAPIGATTSVSLTMRMSVAGPYIVVFGLLALLGGLKPSHAKAPQPASSPQQVEFDGQTMNLAWTNENPEAPIVEYLPKGETLEKWTHLASIRRYPELEDAQKLAKLTVDEVAKAYPGAPTNLADDPNGTGAVIEFVVTAPDDSFAEYNIFKYAKDPQGGVVAQQYALRGYGDRKKFEDELTERRQQLLDEMAEKGLSTPEKK